MNATNNYTQRLTDLRQNLVTNPIGTAKARAYYGLQQVHAYTYTASTATLLNQWYVPEGEHYAERDDYTSTAYLALVEAIRAVDNGTAILTVAEKDADGKTRRVSRECATDALKYRFIVRSVNQAIRQAWQREMSRGATGELIRFDEKGKKQKVTLQVEQNYVDLLSEEVQNTPARDTATLITYARLAMIEMPKRRAQIWELFLNGVNYEEISNRTGLQIKSITAEISRARKDAQKWIEQ